MVKFALFGAGLIGSVHANNIAAHSRATLQYVYDVNTAAAEQVASRFGAQVALSPEEVWDADDVDAVLLRPAEDIVHPREIITPFLRLQRGPGEHPQRDGVHVGQSALPDLFRRDRR